MLSIAALALPALLALTTTAWAGTVQDQRRQEGPAGPASNATTSGVGAPAFKPVFSTDMPGSMSTTGQADIAPAAANGLSNSTLQLLLTPPPADSD